MPRVAGGGWDSLEREYVVASLTLRDGPWCHYCRERLSHRIYRRTVDHVWPQSLGRIDALWNLVLACPDCNSSRGTDLDACSCSFCRVAIHLGSLLAAGLSARSAA